MKKILAWILCVMLMMMYAAPGMASDKAKHDEDLKNVLFGSGGDKGDAFNVIADAVAICIDEFNKSDERLFSDLSKKVQLSMSYEDIELNSVTAEVPVYPNTHRKFTHMGWDFTEYPAKDLWKKRKQLLQETVQQVLFSDSSNPVSTWFSNQLITLKGADKQCDAFCKLVYCVHILGDHKAAESEYQKLTDIEPLTRHEDPYSPSIITDLKACLPVLFVDQNGDRNYMALMQELDMLESESQALGTIDTNEKCEANKEIAEDLIKTLSQYVPIMLRKVDFFKKAFP